MLAVKKEKELYLLPPPGKNDTVLRKVVPFESTPIKADKHPSYPKVLMPPQPSGYIKAPRYDFF